MFTNDVPVQTVDKVNINGDPRVRRCSATINGKTYGYLLAEPEGGFSRTVFLIHGYPDLSVAWRNQIPLFLACGFRTICPDCIGYGWSDSPAGSIIPYTFKSHADDFHQLCRQLGCKDIILGGHDWGAAIAYRFALYHPSFITHLFTLTVPYFPPSPKWIDTATLARLFPSLGYQLQLGSDAGVVESHTHDEAGMRAFLNAAFGGATDDGRFAVDASLGVDFDLVRELKPTGLLDAEEMAFYVERYMRAGMRGPCNYYRNRYQNYLDELALLQSPDGVRLKCPTLFVRATADTVVTDKMARAMVPFAPDLTLKEIQAGHWLLWQRPAEVNAVLVEWMEQQGVLRGSKL